MKNLQHNYLPIVVIHLIATLLAMVSFLDFNIAGLSLAIPLFDVIIIYYFRVFRNIFSLTFLFFLGLIVDSLSGELLGLTSLLYIVNVKIFEYIETRLAIKEEFENVLRRFAAFLASFLFLKWLLLSVINYTSYGILVLVIQFGLSLVCYVVVHKILDEYCKKYIFDFSRKSL